MSDAAAKYRELLTALLLEREFAGGSLQEEAESRFVEELDRCWWALTDVEQREVERAISGDAPPEAPADLKTEDVAVAQGEHRLPRQDARQAA